MGILEAPYYKLPVINIGNRQLGRLNAGNVIFTNYNTKKILKAISNNCISHLDPDFFDICPEVEMCEDLKLNHDHIF